MTRAIRYPIQAVVTFMLLMALSGVVSGQTYSTASEFEGGKESEQFIPCPDGNYWLETQDEVDAFPQGCSYVSRLTITSHDITDLSPLAELTRVRVLIIRFNDRLPNLDGLQALRNFDTLLIEHNPSLTSVAGIRGLVSGSELEITDNLRLNNIDALSGLTSIDHLSINDNGNLTNVDGLSQLTSADVVVISGNSSLTNVNGLSQLTSADLLFIGTNASLTNVDGLRALASAGELTISGCSRLPDVDGLSGLISADRLSIYHNNSLTNVDGLEALTSVGHLLIWGNGRLRGVDGLSRLTSADQVHFSDNGSLMNIDGLNALTSVDDLGIWRNASLMDVDGLMGLTTVERLAIRENPSLLNVDGLSSIRSVGGPLAVADNATLSYCSCGLHTCVDSGCVDGGITMDNNALSGDCNNNGADLVPNACPSPIPLPVPPELVTPTDGSTDVPNAIDLVFRPIEGATRYNIQVSDEPSGSPVLFSSNVPHGPVRFDAPTPGQTYYWRAQAENEGYRSPFSRWWSFTTINPRPDVPALIEPANGADSLNTSVALRWLAADNAERYDVQVATLANFEDILYKQNTPGLSATFVAPHALQTYFWRAQAFGPGGASAGFSPVWSFSVGSEGSLVPRDRDPADGARGVPIDPLLSWTAPDESTAEYYRVQMAGDTTFEALLVDRDSVVGTSLQVNELQHETAYCWRVAGVDENGGFTFTPPACFTTIIAAPSAVTLVSPANGATEVAAYTTFSWDAVDGAAAYHLQVGSDAALSSLVIDDSTLTAATFIASTPLAYSTAYYWHVRAALDDGLGKRTGLLFGPWSETRSFTIAVGTATEDEPGIPTAFALHPAYPNPFNPSTTIRYDVPEAVDVRLIVYDALGRQVGALRTAHSAPGTYSVTWSPRNVPSGVYFVRFEADAFTQTRRMILMR